MPFCCPPHTQPQVPPACLASWGPFDLEQASVLISFRASTLLKSDSQLCCGKCVHLGLFMWRKCGCVHGGVGFRSDACTVAIHTHTITVSLTHVFTLSHTEPPLVPKTHPRTPTARPRLWEGRTPRDLPSGSCPHCEFLIGAQSLGGMSTAPASVTGLLGAGVSLLSAKSVWSCLSLCHPKGCSPPGSSVHGIFPARMLEWVAVSSSKGSSQPRGRALISCVGRQILYH